MFTCRDIGLYLDKLIQLVIELDRHLHDKYMTTNQPCCLQAKITLVFPVPYPQKQKPPNLCSWVPQGSLQLSSSNEGTLEHVYIVDNKDIGWAVKLSGESFSPHRPWDWMIELLPGRTLPHSCIHPLSEPETLEMNEYMTETLQRGYISHLWSPTSASLIFVKKEDGGLWPCIVYHGLIHPPTSVDSFYHWTAPGIYCFHLRSSYNLVRVRAGDEC